MRFKGVLFVLLAAIGWGISGGISSILLSEGWDPYLIAFYRGAIGFALILFCLFFNPTGHTWLDRKVLVGSFIAGLGVAGNFTFYFISIAETNVAIAATLMYCAPVFVFVISIAIGIERSTLGKWFALLLIIAGIVLLTQSYQLDASKFSIIGLSAGLAAGVSYAIFIFGFKYASQSGSATPILLIAFGILIGILWFMVDAQNLQSVWSASSLHLFILLGVIGGGLSFILYFSGLKNTKPLNASIIAMIEPIIATIFSVVIFKEELTIVQLTGILLILLTATYLNINSGSQQK
ncbi:DMT family transporter [Alteromonas ponticola]|uniref:DMT family transporter n=1 Tax=Alteromonas aquimaris TaxID=2998417 RepID=A0ABT3P7B1_9ALTE|nr:EamA family transporter [Alteromonas aquimaris]MCW8108420.1 DMT family transporter [Alteromonas aquimaris]